MGFGFSGEMVFLFFLALILFGPKKLPEIGRQIGRIMNEFRRASNEFRSQIESEIHTLEAQTKPQILPPLQAPLGALASRIFNPPSAENSGSGDRTKIAEAKMAENKIAETKTFEPASALAHIETPSAPAAAANPAIERELSPSPERPKVAPDA
ncbi:MAG: twin-arginine translocase TatA/TatE family subunit [Terriglobales bacterium]